MENASKALIMAGSVLIAVMIIGLIVITKGSFRSVTETYTTIMSKQQIQKINKEFTIYQGRTDIKVHEIITLQNFADDYSETYGITIRVEPDISIDNIEYVNETIYGGENKKTLKRYQCQNIEYNNATGLVSEIIFIETL